MGGHFTRATIESLRKRAGERCSRCSCGTSIPNSDETKATSLGEAAHIRGNRLGPNNRYDSSMSDKERSSIQNGIWLCSVCHKLIDSDQNEYTVAVIEEMKKKHEDRVGSGYFNRLYPEYSTERKIEHDCNIFKASQNIFKESDLNEFIRLLKTQHYIYQADELHKNLTAYLEFHSLISNEYLLTELQKTWDSLHLATAKLLVFLYDSSEGYIPEIGELLTHHIGYKEQSFGLFNLLNQPRYLVNRIYKKAQYIGKLDSLTQLVHKAYKEYRLAIKNQLFI